MLLLRALGRGPVCLVTTWRQCGDSAVRFPEEPCNRGGWDAVRLARGALTVENRRRSEPIPRPRSDRMPLTLQPETQRRLDASTTCLA